MNIGIGLYVRDSVAAVALYQIAFGLELGYHVCNPDGSFYHSELCKDGREILSVVEGSADNTLGKTVQLGMELADADAVKRAFTLLAKDGTVDMPIGPLPWSPCAASVVDKFGVWWYLSTGSHRPDDDFDPTVPIA